MCYDIKLVVTDHDGKNMANEITHLRKPTLEVRIHFIKKLTTMYLLLSSDIN